MEATDHIILGVDPGTQLTGYGVLRYQGNRLQVLAHGVISLGKSADTHPLKLSRIHSRILNILETYLPDEVAIEAPFQGKNVQAMLKLGRAQGVVMAAAMQRDIPVVEYSPRKIKKAITGNGNAAKGQVAGMLARLLNNVQASDFAEEDASDALAAALCHHFQQTSAAAAPNKTHYNGWEGFIQANEDQIS